MLIYLVGPAPNTFSLEPVNSPEQEHEKDYQTKADPQLYRYF
jgi:hypothetical protein